MTVHEIITQWLIDNHYDGLCTSGCGCGVEDLAPCAYSCLDCEPAYKRRALEAEAAFYDVEVGDWYYTTTPPKEEAE